MKKFWLIIILFFIFNLNLFANFKIVDLENEYNSIYEIEKIEWNYNNLSTWYIWNNFDKYENNEVEYSSNLWYFWNNYEEVLDIEVKNIIPVWYFASYSWIILDFWLDDNVFLNTKKLLLNKNVFY